VPVGTLGVVLKVFNHGEWQQVEVACRRHQRRRR
jgi:hypothetical protein